MTPTEIDRRIEALAAERVMGWERVGKGWHTKPFHRPSKDHPGTILSDYDAKGEHDFLQGPDGQRIAFCGCDTYGSLPTPLTSIADAFALLEAHPGWSYEIGVNPRGRYCIVYQRSVDLGKCDLANRDDIELQRAITYACLRAVGAGAELDALLGEKGEK